jgi:hypothetical protein
MSVEDESASAQSEFAEKGACLQKLIELLPVGIIFVDAREH